MDDEPGYGHLSNKSFNLEYSTYILPDLNMQEGLLDVKDHPHQAVKLENPNEIVPILNVKQELLNIEDPSCQPLKLESPTEMLPIIAAEEDLLEIKEEPGILYDLVVSADDSDERNTVDKTMNLRYGSDADLRSLCEDQTISNNTELHSTASSASGMQLLQNVKPSSLPDCKIPSVLQYSRDTVQMRMYKKKNTTTVQSTDTQMRLQTTIKGNEQFLEYKMLKTSDKTLVCTKIKPYTCDTCHKWFTLPSRLKTHRVIHTGSKPYTCDTCHKCFNTPSSLKRHMTLHKGRKPYTCDICNKCFNDLSNLKSHVRIHMGSKPYTCSTCDKCFVRLSHLKQHNRIHTGSKPYTCDSCHKSFSQVSALNKHTLIHTRSKPDTCDTVINDSVT